MSIYAVDFESYYDSEVSITTLGYDAYLRHPDCDIYLVAIVGGDAEEKYAGPPADFDWNCLVGHELWSHNAAFDRRVYHYLRQRDPSLPDLETAKWSCTANLSVYFRGGRSLKHAVKHLLGVDISKNVRDAMKGVTVAQAKLKAPTVAGGMFKTFYDEIRAYALADAKWCRELAVKYGPGWPESERRLSDLTIRGCHAGLPLDVEKLRAGKYMLERKCWEAELRLPWREEGYEATSPKGLAEYCRRAGIPCPPSTAENDPGCQLWEKTWGEKFPWVADMRIRRKANILLKKVNTLLEGEHAGRFPYLLKYFGAHTGRFSGGGEK